MKQEDHNFIAECLLQCCIETAEEVHGLIQPDYTTRDILFRCISVGFTAGRYYEKTEPNESVMQRLKDTLKLIEKNQKIDPALSGPKEGD